MIRKDFPKLGEHYFEERLPNGLLVRVMEKPGFAKRYAFVAADYGSIDAEFFLNGKKYVTPQGVAHYLEHKMFDLPEGNAMQEFAKYAGANNAFTSYTMTAYYVECTEHLEENFEILLRMVTTGYFTDESVQKERGIIAQEIKMYEDSADSAVMENLFRIMYQNHPVRNNIAGTVESIEDITADTLKLCHDAFYDPSNLIVCVIGDVDAAQARVDLMDGAMRNAAYQLAEDAEKYILATIRKGAGTKVSGAIPTADKGGLYGLLISIKNALDLKHVPRFERKLIVPVAIEGQLLMDERFVNGSAAAEARLAEGAIGRAAGFDIYVSADLTNEIIAMIPDAVTFANQIARTDAYRPEKGFCDGVKGLNLCGCKVVQPDGVYIHTITA